MKPTFPFAFQTEILSIIISLDTYVNGHFFVCLTKCRQREIMDFINVRNKPSKYVTRSHLNQ